MSWTRRAARSPAIVVAALALVAALAGTALAGGGATSSAITKSKVKNIANKQANNVIDEATAFAKVDQGGTILAARGVASVTRTAPGDYLVVFDRDITNCANVAGVREVVGNEFHGLVSTYTPAANSVRVTTYDRQGVNSDGNGFNLIVLC
jgi:hypothetical protein